MLGRYRLVRRIAVGGMAELFEARQVETDEPAVVKVVLPQHARDAEFVQMLTDEARLAIKLSHPNLVRVLEYGHEGDQHFLVMEYVQGPTLAALLQAARQVDRPPSPAVALSICRQLLDALRHLHGLTDEQGAALEVVHRDVTPANVLVDRDAGRVKLGDFGIAQHRLRVTRTRTGVIKGTVQYMAPEQVTGSGIDQRTDLYGVGLILFEMLTLRPFIHAEREVELLRLAEEPPWVPPSSLRPGLEPLDRLVRRTLGRFPEERFPDAAAFIEAVDRAGPSCHADELRAWIDGLPAVEADTPALPLEQRPVTRVAPAPRPTRRSMVLLWALLLALPVAAIAALWSLVPGPAGTSDAGRTEAAVAGLSADSRPAADHAAAADLTRPDLTRADLPPRRRHPTPIARPTPDAAPVPPAPPTVPSRGRDELLARLTRATGELQRRGILIDDLPAALRRELEGMGPRLRTEPDPPEAALATLERRLVRVRVDRALVAAKIKRVDRLLRQRGSRVPRELKDRASQALQEFMDGRHGEANRQLNSILRQLR